MQNLEFRIMDDTYERCTEAAQNYPTNVENNTSSVKNATMPPDMLFTNQSLTFVIIYSLCFVVAAIGNLTVFVTLSRVRYRKSRISLMICHLSAADLLVTFVNIPVEIGWRLTVQWIAGNEACKIFAFLRAFGLYLSSNILICVSLDRYFAVLHPLRVNDARRRGKIMLALAWICSIIYALPQLFIFDVSTHPNYPDFQQCVTFNSGVDEATYTIFCVLGMYFVPLIIICWAYTKILCEINSKSRESSDPIMTRSSSNGTLGSNATSSGGSRIRLRRSDMSSIERARSRTLRMTITIVVVFILCWTPYVAMLLWYMMDRDSAEKVDQSLQDALFIMAVANSCANPVVYGSFAVDLKKECCRCFLPYSSNIERPQIEVKLVHRNTAPSVRSRSTDISAVTAIPSICSTSGIPDTPVVSRRLANDETHLNVNRKGLALARTTTARPSSPPSTVTTIDLTLSSTDKVDERQDGFVARTSRFLRTIGDTQRRTLRRN